MFRFAFLNILRSDSSLRLFATTSNLHSEFAQVEAAQTAGDFRALISDFLTAERRSRGTRRAHCQGHGFGFAHSVVHYCLHSRPGSHASRTSSRRSSGPRAGNGQRPGSDELGTRSELLIIGKMIAGGTTNVICKHYDGGAIWRVLSLQHVPSVDWLLCIELCIVFGSCGLFGHSLQLVIIRCQGGPSRSDHYRDSILLCLRAAFIMASSTGASYTSAPGPSSSAAPQPAAAAAQLANLLLGMWQDGHWPCQT